jgi:hydroxymethylpyrimidine pyrophosphatase-like HAD family hydrolase
VTTTPGGPGPARPPRVVATDLDGTLLRSDGTVSARTRRVLSDIEAAGVEVVFVTARPPRWLGGLADVVGGHGRVICLGGAAVWDLESGQAIDTWGFADDVARALVADLRDAVPGIALCLERVSGPVFDPWFPKDESQLPASAWSGPVEMTLPDGATGGTPPVAKLLALAPGTPVHLPGMPTSASATLEELAFFGRVRDAVGDRGHLAYSGAVGLAELLPPGATKDAALARWCARLGVDAADVWAFGDMPNDLPMLRWAGRGLAVANAHPDVLTAADAVVGSHDEDGVAAALEDAFGRL